MCKLVSVVGARQSRVFRRISNMKVALRIRYLDAVFPDGAKVQIRWADTKLARMQVPAVMGAGGSFLADVGPAQVCEIRDPQKSLQSRVFEAGLLRATVAAAPARLPSNAFSAWSPSAKFSSLST